VNEAAPLSGFSHYDTNFDMSEDDRSELIAWFAGQDELPF